MHKVSNNFLPFTITIDISVDAIEVIKELTDGDVYEENPEAVTLLVGELVCCIDLIYFMPLPHEIHS